MDEGKVMILMGIIFLIIAIAFIVISKQISIWSALLIALSLFDMIYGVRKLKR